MKTQKIINFTGMDFREERRPAMRLSRKPQARRNRVAVNVRNIFEHLLGF